MLNLSEDIIVDITSSLREKFDKVYTEFVMFKRKLPFDIYLGEFLGEIWEELSNLIEITDDFLAQVRKRRRNSKKRWVKAELIDIEDDNKRVGFNKQVLLTARLFYEEFQGNEMICMSSFGYATYVEFKQSKIDELVQWSNNDEEYTFDYLYLESKKWNMIESAMRNDILYIVIKEVKERLLKDKSNEILSLPNTMTKLPYDWTNKARFKESNIVERNVNGANSGFFRDVQIIDDTRVLESHLSVDSLKEGLLKESIKTLNATDQEILVYLISIRDEDFYRTGKMVVKIGDIVRGLKRSNGETNYTLIKQSIMKMRFLETTIIDKKTRMVNVKIFLNAEILTEDELDTRQFSEGNENAQTLITNKRKSEFAVLHFSDELVREIVKGDTTSVYKTVFNQFTSRSAKILIYPLQRERIACWRANPKAETLTFQVNLNYFKRIILFTISRRDRQIKLIEEGLNEIVIGDNIIKSYERRGDKFTIHFNPLTDKEIEDLIYNNKPPLLMEVL